jgi:Mg-chelatase subunit ChlD
VTQKKNPSPRKTARLVHCYVLLDRSGSMSSMASDVIGGFNGFLAGQRAAPGRARMTLVQFDTQDPHEVLATAARLAEVDELSTATFRPRGGTPLLDATAALIEQAMGRESLRRATGKAAEEIVFVTITDGEENQSRNFTLEQVRALIADRTEAGWSFVFLGAGADAYREAGRLGYDTGSVQEWAADGTGVQAAFTSLSRATAALRTDVLNGAAFDKADYFRGVKEAEDDKSRRT